jgi:hypothetical protein
MTAQKAHQMIAWTVPTPLLPLLLPPVGTCC